MKWCLTVFRFENGLIAVTLDDGGSDAQVPELQGPEAEALPKIAEWFRGRIPANPAAPFGDALQFKRDLAGAVRDYEPPRPSTPESEKCPECGDELMKDEKGTFCPGCPYGAVVGSAIPQAGAVIVFEEKCGSCLGEGLVKLVSLNGRKVRSPGLLIRCPDCDGTGKRGGGA